MTVETFIRERVLLPRLQEQSVLVVYDPEQRYRQICQALAAEERVVVDATESSIEAREAALEALQQLGRRQSKTHHLLIYVPAPVPLTDEAKQIDPFALYAAIGGAFPAGDGDEYFNLCLKAKADHATAIRRLFAENPNPPFAVVNAVGSGAGWPILQAQLRVESASELLFALLVPTDSQRESLKGEKASGWVGEARALLQNAFGLTLQTKLKSWEPVAEELWRFLLFSEFVFDLGADVPLPDGVAGVPHAPIEARSLIEDLCDRLRSDGRTQAIYIERAEAIERSLLLAERTATLVDLGVRATFAFEERAAYAQAADALQRDNLDKVRAILTRRVGSVWEGRGESQLAWELLEVATELVQACRDSAPLLTQQSRSQGALVDFYLSHLREVDRRQREFEQTAADALFAIEDEHAGAPAKVIHYARRLYRQLMEQVQPHFMRHLEQSGWPPPGRLAATDFFDRIVAPKLQNSGHRVALFFIDALRYELGVELHKQLAGDDPVEIQPLFAPLPSITPVGMAALLPGAAQNLRLTRQGDALAVQWGEQPMNTVAQRLDLLRRAYGQRFYDARLVDFVRNPPRADALPDGVDLLVLRSNEMDSDFESNPEAAPSLISRTFQQIRAALRHLATLHVHEAVIVADHGFYLHTGGEPGDQCAKPPGNWVAVHNRFLLGAGSATSGNFVLPAATLGIRGDFDQAAGPRAVVSYQSGAIYLHGGASLQECITPVLTVQLRPAVAEVEVGQRPKVTLTYKRGAKYITTRVPVLEVALSGGGLFSQESTVELVVEAHDKQGQVVGEAKPGGVVNPATHTLTLRSGDAVQVTLRMEESFEGKFTVKALDPATQATWAKLELETDYTV